MDEDVGITHTYMVSILTYRPLLSSAKVFSPCTLSTWLMRSMDGCRSVLGVVDETVFVWGSKEGNGEQEDDDSEEENELVQRTILWARAIVRQEEQEEEESARGEWTWQEGFPGGDDTEQTATEEEPDTTDTVPTTELTEQDRQYWHINTTAIQVLYIVVWIALLLAYKR